MKTIVLNSAIPKSEKRFTFGQYRGRLISDIIIQDPEYVKFNIQTGRLILTKFKPSEK